MKGTALSLVTLLLLTSLIGCFGEDEPAPEPPLEDIRLNHLTMKGTHNSYHVKLSLIHI